MDIGGALRTGREARKLTQTELGKLAGISRQAVADIERNGGRVAHFHSIEKIIPISISRLPHADTLGERLKLARVADGMTLREVAAQSKIAVNTIRQIEAGRGTLGPLLRYAASMRPNARVKPITSISNRRGLRVVGWRADKSKSPADYYASPAPIVRLLLDHEEFDQNQTILEPAVGEARVIARVLRERGFKDVVCFDLHGEGDERKDFFALTDQYHTIITNPPFSLHRQFIQHAKRIATNKIAFLLPLNYLTGSSRHEELWTDRTFPLAKVHVLNRGVDFIGSDPHADSFRPSQLYCAWFVFEKAHCGPPTLHWIDSNRLIERKGLKAERSPANDVL